MKRYFFRTGTATAMGLALMLAACGDIDQTAQVEGQPEMDDAVEEVEEDPAEYAGETLTLSGEVGEIYGDDAFLLREEDGLIDDDEILVINVDPQYTSVSEGDEVQVVGEVRQFVLADIERDYDVEWDGDVEAEIEAEYDGRPVVIAESTIALDEIDEPNL